MFIVQRKTLLSLQFLVLISACSNQTGENTATEISKADTIYTGGVVITMNDAQPAAEAMAVADGRIIGVGSAIDIGAYRGNDTVEIDLEGHTLSPGFIDGHAHVAFFGSQAVGANLLAGPDGDVETIDDLVAKLQEFAAGDDVERTGWIFGIGYDDSIMAERRHPTRDDLDRVSTDLPVMAGHISGHFAAVNSKGLEILGLDSSTPDPEGGVIRRRPGSQVPNGVLEELAAIPFMMEAFAPKTLENSHYFMRRGLEMAMSFGYTTAQEGRAFAASHDALAEYAGSVGFPIDVVSYIDYSDTSPLKTEWNRLEYVNGYRVGGMKVTLDGSPQGRTAWRTKPYLIPPEGQDENYLGYPAIPGDDTVIGLLDAAYQNDWQVLMHANGDAAIDQMLLAVGTAHEKFGSGDRRHTLIHGQYVREDQLHRMAELEMTASLFPMHTYYWGDWHSEIIGEELGYKISPTRTALDLGLPLTSHSDAPVALPNLMQVVWATVNRVSRSGKVIGPGERLTPLEAMKSITLWSARQHFEEEAKGSIEVGKLADLVILSENPLTIEPERLNEIIVLETIKEGKSVWKRTAH